MGLLLLQGKAPPVLLLLLLCVLKWCPYWLLRFWRLEMEPGVTNNITVITG